ncbi:hypothetical protein B566_EDAN015834 [Ephemera danica]|nr:hypothetical protein B566_EDAN015834 [Ephemera danica]
MCSSSELQVLLWLCLCAMCALNVSGAGGGGTGGGGGRYSTRIVRTRYGSLRGIITLSSRAKAPREVEAFLGVPYATPPVASLRYMPPLTPQRWRGPRLADLPAPACPQAAPEVSITSPEALLRLPRARITLLRRLMPLLANSSEDCLYLNLYIPRPEGLDAPPSPLPLLVLVHGESYEWGSSAALDGSALAAHANIAVCTLNFRLGILGFLKTGPKGNVQGNFGLMDIVAGLHWLRENAAVFGVDPERITLFGHTTGAALVHLLSMAPAAKGLFSRVVLASGSALSPWALQMDPLAVKRRVAEHTGCHGDLEDEDIAPCLRNTPLSKLMAAKAGTPRFLPGFAPFIDGGALVPIHPAAAMGMSSLAMGSIGLTWDDANKQQGPAAPYQSFLDTDLMLVVTTVEAYEELSAQDLEFGLNETRRDRLLRTLVRNVFRWHLNEIFSALRNEYTDWERAAGLAHNPLGVRDAALYVLGDGLTVAPLSRVAALHTAGHGTGKTFFAHIAAGDSIASRDFPQRPGSVRGEDIPYWLAQPLLPRGSPGIFTEKANYSLHDADMAKACVHYLSNFVKSGDPNIRSESAKDREEEGRRRTSTNPSQHSHQGPLYWDKYDTVNQLYLDLGHKLSLWLHLIPQLHRPGSGDTGSRHHHFLEEGPQYYDGVVRPQSNLYPSRISPPQPSPSPQSPSPPPLLTTTECPPSPPPLAPLSPPNNTFLNHSPPPTHQQNNDGNSNSMSTALIVTVTVGCALLLLNLLIFAGIYRHHHRRSMRHRRHHAEKSSHQIAGPSNASPQMLKESPPPLMIPAPPPPPKNLPPPDVAPYLPPQPGMSHHASAGGILRNNSSGPSSTPSTPGTAKKRVHILEISV